MPPEAPSSNAKLLIPATPGWFNFLPPLPIDSTSVPSASQLALLLNRASSLHASEVSTFSLSNVAGSSASDRAFLRNILSGGTLSDRLSALTLIVQGAPLHNVRALEALKSLTEKRRGVSSVPQEGEKGKGRATGREDRLKAARAIMDWWVGGGAPNRKLRYFRDQPLLHPNVTDQHLIVWYFEDWLKKYFFSYLQILESFSLDPLQYVRMQSLALITTLLRSNPEQEQNLLRLLVNKLGDTESAICARTSHHLLYILQEHPAMKTVIIREMTALIMRPTPLPSLSTPQPQVHVRFPSGSRYETKREENAWLSHARYYAAITFNQIVLSTSEGDRGAVRTLIDVYFQLFREVVDEQEAQSVDDVVPIPEGTKVMRAKRNPKEHRAHSLKSKEVRGAAGFAEVQDSNAKLLGAILTGINRALPYAHFKGENVQLGEHMDTLFLLVHTSTFNITLRALTLIQQVAVSFPPSSPMVSRYYRALYATLLDSRLHTTRNQALFLNLLFKSLKADSHQPRIMAFVKRFCQVLVNGFGGSEFIAGGLWLLGELFSVSPGLRSLIDEIPESGIEGAEYDPYKREPQYTCAQSSGLWELTTLVHHAHPTISLLARQLISHEPLTSSPDLTLYTFTHFLDRFVYKNPKKASARGTSAMQPSAVGGPDGVRRVRADIQEKPVNIEEWWRRREGGVPADQIFFQRYFAQKHEKERARAAKIDKRKTKYHGSDAGSEQDDGSDEGSDSEETVIWKAMKASMPRAEGADDSGDGDGHTEHSIPDSESDEHASSDTEEDRDELSESEHDDNLDGGFDDIGFSSAEDSDTDDLVHLDAETPVDIIQRGQTGSAAQESPVFGGGKKRKRKGPGKEDMQIYKKKLRDLPTFASYEDFAEMIEDDSEENL